MGSLLAQTAGSLRPWPTSTRFLAAGISSPPQTSRPLIVPELPCARASNAPQTTRAAASQVRGERTPPRIPVTNIFTDRPLCLLETTLRNLEGSPTISDASDMG